MTSNSVTIGTSMPYSGFLRRGTSKMARRKMSDNALEEGMKAQSSGPVGGMDARVSERQSVSSVGSAEPNAVS